MKFKLVAIQANAKVLILDTMLRLVVRGHVEGDIAEDPVEQLIEIVRRLAAEFLAAINLDVPERGSDGLDAGERPTR